MSHTDSSFFVIGDKRKQMSAGDRAKAMFDEAKETNPNKKVLYSLTKKNNCLPTTYVALGNVMFTICPVDHGKGGPYPMMHWDR